MRTQVGNKWRRLTAFDDRARTIAVVKRWRSCVVALGLVPALAGCSQACTAVGCGSGVAVDLSKVGAQFGSQAADATLCVNGDCHTDKVRLTDTTTNRVLGHPMSEEPPVDPRVTVTLKLARNGKVLLDTHADITLAKFAPNGERCGPVCYTSQLVLIGTTLQQGPLPT
jgi:hypothetical protein